LHRQRDVIALVVCGALASTLLSATIGVASLCAGGVHPWSAATSLWLPWWIGDAVSDLVVAPVILVWADALARGLERRRAAEGAAVVVTAAAVALAVFAGRPAAALSDYPLHYTAFPVVVWAALRLRQPGSTAITFLVWVMAVASTLRGHGPFAMATPHESLLVVQLFMAMLACTGLLLAAATAERDAAERRRAADFRALELSENRLRLALETGRMSVWDWDVRAGTVDWTASPAPMPALRTVREQAAFEGFLALAHPDDRERVQATIRGALHLGARWDVEFRALRPDGGTYWLAAAGTVLRDAVGTPLRMVGIVIDVTERRRLEQELRARAEQLADSDRRKDEFLAMLAHELRNPLAPLSMSLQLLALDLAGRERFLAMADRQVKHLVRLVDDLLDVSRITRGKIALRREPVALGDVVARAVELTRPLVDAGGHELSVSLPAEPLRVEGDPVRLVQVFANLLGNAAKYTPASGSIWVTAERVAERVVVRVRDTGIGIPPELLPRVFDLFVQGEATIDRRHGGLGIGLTLVRAIVELHDGRVEARSPGVGLGSEFLVWLPALAAGEPALAPAAPGMPTTARRLRILVVEDNRDAAESLAALLDIWGHEVRTAYDGLAALRHAEGMAPDLILSDLGLPGMDGYELARQLRARPAFGRVVLVALTGYGRDEDRRRAVEAGFDHHLVKPPDLSALLELIRRVAATGEQPRTLH
jgi:signal transduction histidine kinase/ActR/RegA family two-component response regulator